MKQQLLILTSPPASGKTHFIQNLRLEVHEQILLIVPLRALAEELRARWGQTILVMTHEEWLSKRTAAKIIIFDEFHLHFYWGDSFRPKMWEAFYGCSLEADLIILLTATLNDQAKKFLIDLDYLFEIHWMDYGNQNLLYRPLAYRRAPSVVWLTNYILQLPQNTTGNLIFCRYRQEVNSWEIKLKERGFSVWTCLGGEAQKFSKMVGSEKPPQFIVATTVLSHGVNLPRIENVYFTYAVGNIDFWIQMVARGGRKGEAYSVMALEKPFNIRWSCWTNTLAICWLTFKIDLRLLFSRVEKWFLKE